MNEQKLPCAGRLVMEYDGGRMPLFPDSPTTISSEKSISIKSHGDDKGQIDSPKQSYHHRNRSRQTQNFPYPLARRRGSQGTSGNEICLTPVRTAMTSKYVPDIELAPYRKKASNILPALTEGSQMMQENFLSQAETADLRFENISVADPTISVCGISVGAISQENLSANEPGTSPSMQSVENRNSQKSSIYIFPRISHSQSYSSDIADECIRGENTLPEQLSLEHEISRILRRESGLSSPSFSNTCTESLKYRQVPEYFQENLGSEADQLLTICKELQNQKRKNSGTIIDWKQPHFTEIQAIDSLENMHQCSGLCSSVAISGDAELHSDDEVTEWETTQGSDLNRSSSQDAGLIEHEITQDSKIKQSIGQSQYSCSFHPGDIIGPSGEIVLDISNTHHDSHIITSHVSSHSHDVKYGFMKDYDSHDKPKKDGIQMETLKVHTQDHLIKRLIATPKKFFSPIISRTCNPCSKKPDLDHIKNQSQGSVANSEVFKIRFLKARSRNLLQRCLKHIKNKSLQLDFVNSRYRTPQNGILGDLSIPLRHSYEGLLTSSLVGRDKFSGTSSEFIENGRKDYLDLMASFADNECIIAYYEDGPRIFSRRQTQSAQNRESRRIDAQIKFDVFKVTDLVVGIAGEVLYPDLACEPIRSSRVAFETSRSSGPIRYFADLKSSGDKEDSHKQAEAYSRLSLNEAEQFIDCPANSRIMNLLHIFSHTKSRKKHLKFLTSKLTKVQIEGSREILGQPTGEHQTSDYNLSVIPGFGDDYLPEDERAYSHSQNDRHNEPCNINTRMNAKLISVALLLFCFILPPVLFPIFFLGGFDFLISFFTKGRVPRCSRAQKRWALWASLSSLIIVMIAVFFLTIWLVLNKNKAP